MTALLVQGLATKIPFPDKSVDLVFGSPPYMQARKCLENGRDLGVSRDCRSWVDWMISVTREALRVSRGPVCWVVGGQTKKRQYQPGIEGLIWEWYKSGGYQECPCYWHRVGISGSGGDQWFRKDIEQILCFKRDLKFPWSNNTAMGHPPKWAPGGDMSHRVSDGTRRNQWGSGEKSGAARKPDGSHQAAGRAGHVITTKKFHQPSGATETQGYQAPVLANPGNLIKANVGGGLMGHPLAHSNEAPYPVQIPRWFILSLCKPGGLVLDPFSGSGTTVEAALQEGRQAIGMDLRFSQCELATRRLASPHKPKERRTSKADLLSSGNEKNSNKKARRDKWDW